MTAPASQYSSGQIQGAISMALRAGDMEAVAGLLRMLAVVDPHAAEYLVTFIRLLPADGSAAVPPSVEPDQVAAGAPSGADAVRALHVAEPGWHNRTPGPVCVECMKPYPCPTITAMGGAG